MKPRSRHDRVARPLAMAALAGALWTSPAGAADAPAPGPAPGPGALATATVGASGAAASYTADGRVEAVREATISAQISGQVTSLGARTGDKVRAGQELARIDARAASQNEAAIGAQFAAAQAQLEAAERSYERTKTLVEQKFLSPANLDRAQADRRAAEEAVKALQAQRAAAATQTGWHRLVAPFDGVVTSVPASVGETAMPGKPLMLLHDPRRLRVAIDVPAGIVARLSLEQGSPQVEIPDAAPQARSPQVSGVVVVSAADPVAHTQLVRLELKDPQGLHPGLFARVRLALKAQSGADAGARLTMPRSALVERGDLRAVYVVSERGVALRQVRVGRASGDRIEVLSGLASGERVALDPVAAARVTGRSAK